jgi:ribose transport system substrate-binding protein
VAASTTPTVDQLAGPDSFEGVPPTSGPKPVKGKTIWWISCGQSIPDCSVPAAAAQQAANLLGYKFHIADSNLNVGGGYVNAFRTAMAAKPDLIIVHGIGCPSIAQPLGEAMQAGIKVLGVEANDCSDIDPGAKDLYIHMQYSAKAPSSRDYLTSWGTMAAEYVIADSGGKAKYILNYDSRPDGQYFLKGFETAMAACSGCTEAGKIGSTPTDMGPGGGWIQELRAALIKAPDANAVIMPYDFMMASSGGAAAVHQLDPNARVYGGTGQAPVMDLVREGLVRAVTGAHSGGWMGYAAIDEANRILSGQPTVPEGVGVRPVDAQHNLPSKPGTAYESPVDYKALYLKEWGLN